MNDGVNRSIRLKEKRNIIGLSKLNQIISLLNIIILIFYISTTQENSKHFIINFSSEIHLIIHGKGTQDLLNKSFYLEPSKVIVNGVNKDTCKMSCELENEENNRK